ncbi:MAG: reverse transcriptase domain-containing protein, partial [Patescibacteria group bacterium]|nr:reverse transcriptase domain-containing protein [Patescibacteria group bacterium]
MSFDKKEINNIQPMVFFYLLKNHFPYSLFMITKNILQIICIWQKPDFTVYKNYKDHNPLMGTTKYRTIHAPNVSMRMIHGIFIKNFLRKLPIGKGLRFATGGRKGWNPLRNVERHKNGRFFYLIDIKDFYNNIDGEKLSEILCSLDKRLTGKEDAMFAFLKKYFILKNGKGLITGAPASVDLANIYLAYTVDHHLARICQKNDIGAYSRYLDDLTFSSLKPFGKRLRGKIRQIILNAGFGISHHK